MQLQFVGWSRMVTLHTHKVMPLRQVKGGVLPDKDAVNVKWTDSLTVQGKVEDLALSGAFRMQCKFNQEELEAWLFKFAQENPKRARKVLGQALSIATGDRSDKSVFK